uniref:Uncharacterized protein n=1 Tax=Prolemur simus TaxID=1328070 RepID=A0A8C8YSI4_PROSS
QQPSGAQGCVRVIHPSSEGWDAQVSALWRDLGARLSVRGPLTTSATPPTSIVPRKVRARGKPKTGAKSTLSDGGRDPQRPLMEALVELPSEPQSPDEFREVPMRVSIYPKGQVQGEPSSPEEPGDTPRYSSLLLREKKLPMQGTLLTSPPWGLVSGVERQAVGELDSSSSKKMQGVVWGKAGNRPGFPGASAAAVGSLPRAVPRKKVAQEKKCPGTASNLALGGAFPPWGQRISAVALKPVTLPPIAGVGLLGRSQNYSLVSSGHKHSKHSSTGKKSGARKAKVSKPVARDDNDPSRDPRQTCLHMHHGEFSSDNANTRAPQAPGNSQATAVRLGRGIPCSLSRDQEPPVHAPRPERQQQPPGAQGCPEVMPGLAPGNPGPDYMVGIVSRLN